MAGLNIGTVTTYYRGKFVETWPLRYTNAWKRSKIIDGDYLRLVSIWGHVADLGYPRDQVRNIYYKGPSEDFYNMRVLAGDTSVREMVDIMRKEGEVELYVDHGVVLDDVVDPVDGDGINGGPVMAINGPEDVEQPAPQADEAPQEEIEDQLLGEVGVAADVEDGRDGDADVEDNMSQDDPQEDDFGVITQDQQPNLETINYYGTESDYEDSNYEGLSEADLEDEDLNDELASDDVCDEEILKVVRRARKSIHRRTKKTESSKTQQQNELRRKLPKYAGVGDDGPVEVHSASQNSSSESGWDSMDDSDNPGQLNPFPSDDEDYVPGESTEMWYDPNWEVPYFACGMRFTDNKQFKDAMATYAIKRCYGIKCIRSEPGRQKYICKDDCEWEITASYDEDDQSFRIKGYNSKHSCLREYRSHLATAEWLANFFQKRIKEEPFYKVKQLIKDARNELNLDLRANYYKVNNAKTMVLKKMEGNYKEEYAMVQGYANYMKSVNPNNTIKVSTARRTAAPGSPLMFTGMYFCFEAVKEGWKKGCRPIIGLDGCHLKGICQEVLLVAVGRDANDNVYPIAWAVVEVESYETWYNFIKQLSSDLDLKDGERITILSDRNPGLLRAREVLLPNVEHRHCSRHLYGNWGKRYKGKNFRAYFWRCVRAPFPESFSKEMDRLRQKTESGFQELIKLDGHNWCKSMFRETSKCDVPHNNISESFNNMILPARYLPIISMSEWIYNYILEKRGILLDKGSKWKGDIAPRTKLKLKVNSILSRHMGVKAGGQLNFRVHDGLEGWVHTVKLIEETCSCRYWQLNGIPCAHVITCCDRIGAKPQELVSDWYKKEKYMLTYEQPLECHRGPEMWINYGGEKIEAPVLKCKPGRPRKNRFKSKDEVVKVSSNKERLSKAGSIMHCSGCKSTSHNIRTCPTKGNTPSTVKRKKMPRGRQEQKTSFKSTIRFI